MNYFRLSCLLMVLGLATPADAFDWSRPLGQFQLGSPAKSAPTLAAPVATNRAHATSHHEASHQSHNTWYTYDRPSGCGTCGSGRCGSLWGGFCREKREIRSHIGCRSGCRGGSSCWRQWFSWRPQIHCWNLKCKCRKFRDMFSWSGFGNRGCGCAGGSHAGEFHEGAVIESDEPAAPPVPEPAAESTTSAWDLWPRPVRLMQVPLGI